MRSSIIREVHNSFNFIQDCVNLVNRAYECLFLSGVVNHDMQENTLSENLRRIISQDILSWNRRIVVIREQTIGCSQLLTSNETANTLPRIDFQFVQSWNTSSPPLEFYIEAKNLYANDFKKSGCKSLTLASNSHKRYVETGINNLLTGYYPDNSCLLGYVLEGAVCDAVDGVNKQIYSILTPSEVLKLDSDQNYSLKTYTSLHSNGRQIQHLMLQF